MPGYTHAIHDLVREAAPYYVDLDPVADNIILLKPKPHLAWGRNVAVYLYECGVYISPGVIYYADADFTTKLRQHIEARFR